jgi:YjbE family integral membrane protein
MNYIQDYRRCYKIVDEILLILQIILINMVLSGDNAVVIAMASRKLPEKQRKLAVWWGAGLAVALRLILTVVAVLLLQTPYLQAIGAFLLMYVAMKLLNEGKEDHKVKTSGTLAAAVWTIVLADFVMSLDNVLAIAAIARGNFLILVIGIGTSLPLIIWGSSLITKLLHKYPILIYLGAGILGYTAGKMFIHDVKVKEWLGHAHITLGWLIPILFTVTVIGYGLLGRRKEIYG